MKSRTKVYNFDWAQLRDLLGWSQYITADFLGITRSNIAHYAANGYITVQAWDRLMPIVCLAVELRKKGEALPISLLPNCRKPEVIGDVEIFLTRMEKFSN